MTDPEMADVTYIEPITWQVVERIIDKERPDAILPTMGGQTALNCALDLHRHGVLEKYNVELIGATPEAIDKAEDRSEVQGRDDQDRPGFGAFGHRAHDGRSVGRAARDRLPDHHPSIVHDGRQRRRHRLQRRRIRSDLQARPGSLANHGTADRRVAARLERVRDGSGARQERTTASSSARSRTSIRWACTPATRSPSRRRRR